MACLRVGFFFFFNRWCGKLGSVGLTQLRAAHMPFFLHVTLSFNKTLRFASPKTTYLLRARAHTHRYVCVCNQTQSPAATASTAINLRTHFDGQIVIPTLTTVPLLLSSFCFVWQPATIFILLLSYRNCLRNLDKLKLYHISCFLQSKPQMITFCNSNQFALKHSI